MDFTFLSEIIANFISFLFSFFDGVDLSPIGTALDYITPYVKAALYLLPTQTISQIFTIVCVIWGYRLIILTLRTLWDILPIA